MKIVIAPDSFKESLSAKQAAEAIYTGFHDIFPEADYVKLPIADGGEGTTKALVDATAGTYHNLNVTGPMGKPVVATWGHLGNADTAIIEVAAAAGLHLVAKADRNPWLASSQGVGEIIRAVLDQGIRHILIGLGGSATNDGGAGMLAALGARFYDQNGQELPPTPSGLVNLYCLDLGGLDSRLSDTRIEVACDVTNPLLGPQGASYTFGRQKGASDEVIADLDHALGKFAAAMSPAVGKDLSNCAGAGAAGGIGYAVRRQLG